ncbi:solute carrier organic anion transporter family member 2B1-like [Rhincodon typus]|uniref:solute carrier organic anion transporter family member 2B1-like n=1 Tax=Rhincodon typus TaxID=259920 RepID=UPI00203029F5|nr:solute carrier organic anion transporter family member 2B1-like [Rhincodon typus]
MSTLGIATDVCLQSLAQLQHQNGKELDSLCTQVADSRDPEGEINTDKKLNELKSKQDDVTQGLSLLQFIKSFPCILLRTLRSTVYLLVVFAQVCMSALMSGLTVFIGKFLEQQFTVTASFANLLIGSIHVPGAVLGIILGGAIMRRFQINLRGSAIMCFAAIFASICATTPLLFLGCSTQVVAGINDNLHTSNSTSGLELSCNRGCSCKDQAYNPVCTTDGIEFVSPCHAGCMSASFETDGKVVLLRSVKPEDKSLAIGIQFMLFRVLAWLPGPILYGSAIDTTCIRWEKKCNKKASCRYYNLDLFRVRYIGLQMLFQCGAFLLFVMAYYFLKKETLRREQQAKMGTKAALDPRVEEERKKLMEQDGGTKLQLKSKAGSGEGGIYF